MAFKNNPTRLNYFLLFCCIVGYFFSSLYISKNIFIGTNFNYFTALTDAFIHGHINVVTANTYDLTFFHNKWYLYWGPASFLFVLPFYIIWQSNTSDIFFTLVAGSASIILFYFVIQEWEKYLSLNFKSFSKWIIILAFAFASPNFYLSLNGHVWFSEQIIGVFYILISLLFFLKYLQKNTFTMLSLSVIFFNLAWLTRYVLIFYGLLFVYPLIQLFLQNKRKFFPTLLVIGGICSLGLITFFTYNYSKFQNPFETGLSMHNGSPRFSQIIAARDFFSPKYIPYNSYYYFLNPPSFTSNFPYFLPDWEGNSFFIFYPYLLLFVLLPKYIFRLPKIKKILFLSMLSSVILLILLYLDFFTTGWSQIGSRYFLDITPLLLLLLSCTVESVPPFILFLLVAIGAYLNIFGGMMFYLYK